MAKQAGVDPSAGTAPAGSRAAEATRRSASLGLPTPVDDDWQRVQERIDRIVHPCAAGPAQPVGPPSRIRADDGTDDGRSARLANEDGRASKKGSPERAAPTARHATRGADGPNAERRG